MAYKQKNFFEFRDSLPKGDADKVIKGMHFDEEFAAIEGAFEKVTGDIELDGKPLPELLDEKADQADLEQEIKDRIEGDKLLQGQIDALEEGDKALQGNIDGLADDLAQEIIDRQNGDSALDKRIDELATDDLTDVNSATATKDQFLIHNGSQWIAEDFHIDTELTFQGGISVPNDPAPAASNGDLYINNEDGVVGSSWTGIAGRTINTANAVGWSAKNNRWYMLGDIASAAVLKVEPGTGIDVDASKPAEPVVSIDRTEVDKWYEPPIDPKRTAFNKNFGTAADTVAEGNHTHDSDYAPAGHNHDGAYEPVINPKNTAFNKNFGATAGTVAEGNHTHTTNDLSDVSSGSAKKDDFLIHNGTQWIAEAFHIDTELTYQGAWNLTAAPPTTKNNGDLYINNTSGVVNAGWTGIAGEAVREGNVVGWAASKNRWYLLGDIASSAVTQVKAGTAISVDSSAPSEPVVSLDKAETDKWYQPKGNYLTDFTETDPTVPNHVKGITQNDINNWNNAASGGAYTLPLATNGTRGGVQIGYGENGKNYAVKLSGEQMYVTVPWTDTQNPNYSLPLAANGTRGGVQVGYTTSGKNYAVQLSGEKMYVNVPWTDTTTDLTGYATQSWVSANYQPKGNYALVGDSYTKAESDAKYELKGEGGGGLPDGDWICEGSIFAKGNITAYWASDERLKDDIGPMPIGLIDGIAPATFKWKDSGKSSGGVIAQQLQRAGLGDWVNEAPNGDLGVDYNALIGALLAEVQDLKARVKELE